MSVYFSQLNLNGSRLSVPAEAGWFESENLRMIHALRYKPECKSETEFSYQPQIFSEKSNDVLANLARGKFEVETVFEANGKEIKSGCWIEAKGDNLKDVGVTNSEKILIAEYADCDSFFYSANRNPILSPKYDSTSDGDNSDATRGLGLNNLQSTNIFNPAAVYFEFDYARLYKDTKATEIVNRIDDVFKQAGAKLNFVLDVFKSVKGLLINGSPSAKYQIRETLSLALDLLMRLSGIHKCDLNSSAIVLIENPHSLISDILTDLFPNVQFIVE